MYGARWSRWTCSAFVHCSRSSRLPPSRRICLGAGQDLHLRGPSAGRGEQFGHLVQADGPRAGHAFWRTEPCDQKTAFREGPRPDSGRRAGGVGLLHLVRTSCAGGGEERSGVCEARFISRQACRQRKLQYFRSRKRRPYPLRSPELSKDWTSASGLDCA
jgi:hypothetical protein